MCYRIVKNEHFETVILALIILRFIKIIIITLFCFLILSFYIQDNNFNLFF